MRAGVAGQCWGLGGSCSPAQSFNSAVNALNYLPLIDHSQGEAASPPSLHHLLEMRVMHWGQWSHSLQ